MNLRTMLFTPVNHARHVEKALGGPADAVILDLEDAVAVEEKPAARRLLADLLQAPGGWAPALFIRVNALSTPFAHADLRTAVRAGVAGILLPKVEAGAHLATADWFIGQLEAERGLEPNGIELLPLIETAAGVTRIDDIAIACARVRRLTFGAGDFTLDTNMEWTPANEGVLFGRVRTVLASRAGGLAAPIDTVFPNLPDHAGFEAETRQARRLGFGGKLCLHPDQVDIANAVFTPTEAEVAEAERILAAFATAVGGGSASIKLDGRFIDYPIAERARRVLESRRPAIKEETTA